MTGQLESETGPVLAALLSELADVFLKAEGYDDALEAAVYANQETENLRNETVTYANRVLEQDAEIDRLQDQYAEASEEAFARGEIISDLNDLHAERVKQINKLAGEVADRNRTIQDLVRVDGARLELVNKLQHQLDTARRTFGDAFVHGPVGPTRKNRPKLTRAEVGGIRSMVGNGSTITAVAKTYGVHPSTVSRIVSGVYHREENA